MRGLSRPLRKHLFAQPPPNIVAVETTISPPEKSIGLRCTIDVRDADWDTIRDIAYEGRGG